MLFAVIIACEIGFWVILAAGLAARYLLRMRRLGAVLLFCTPVVDLVLFAATVLDLRGGATASTVHGLAAAYIGFSIAFGHSLIRWADQRVAHRFFGGPPPWKPPHRERGPSARRSEASRAGARPERESQGGRARAAYEWREWLKGLLGWAVACAMLGGGILMIGDWERSQELAAWAGRLSVALVIWLVFWPVWATVSSLGEPEHGPRDGGEHDLDPATVEPDVRVRARDDRVG